MPDRPTLLLQFASLRIASFPALPKMCRVGGRRGAFDRQLRGRQGQAFERVASILMRMVTDLPRVLAARSP
jgi:hypothetical protein